MQSPPALSTINPRVKTEPASLTVFPRRTSSVIVRNVSSSSRDSLQEHHHSYPQGNSSQETHSRPEDGSSLQHQWLRHLQNLR